MFLLAAFFNLSFIFFISSGLHHVLMDCMECVQCVLWTGLFVPSEGHTEGSSARWSLWGSSVWQSSLFPSGVSRSVSWTWRHHSHIQPVWDIFVSLTSIFPVYFQLMGTGQSGLSGQSVMLSVEVVSSIETEPALLLLLRMEDRSVKAWPYRAWAATTSPAPRMWTHRQVTQANPFNYMLPEMSWYHH